MKLVEIRDIGTRVEALAVKMSPDRAEEFPFLRDLGFGSDSRLVYLIKAETQEAHYDPFCWGNTRTMRNAHRYIQKHFDELPDFGVVDVEYILGETDKPKTSEIWR